MLSWDLLNRYYRLRAIEIGNYTWHCGDAIVAMAAKTPHKQQTKLVQFVLELQNQVPKTETGDEFKSKDGVIWRDLPELGWAARDAWNFYKFNAFASYDFRKWLTVSYHFSS